MKIEGLTIDEVTDLGNNDLCLTMDDGTTIVGHMFVVEGSKPAAPAKPAAKEEEKPVVKPAPTKVKVPTWDELQDMDLDDLKDCIDDHDLDIKTKGKDEDDLKEEIAEELKIEEPPKKKKEEAKPAADAKDDLTWKDLSKMDYDELGDLVKEEGLKIAMKDYDEDEEAEVNDLRKAIAKKMDIEVPKK